MNKLCRACLTNVDSDVLASNVLDIVQDPDDPINSPNLFTKLTDITLDRSDDDRMPQTLCQPCLDKFEMIKYFRLTCIQSNDWLVQQLWENKCFNRDLNIDDSYNDDEPVPIKTEIEFLDLAHFDQTLPSDEEQLAYVGPPATVHHKESPPQHYECDLCAMRFYTRRHIEDHLRQHCGLEPVEFKKSLHQRHRGGTECPVYRCSFDGCKRFFEFFPSLKKHEERVHLGISRSTSHTLVLCEICGISISNARLKAHKLRHTDVKTVECSMCDMRTFTKNEMNAHQRVHNGAEYSVSCAMCESRFRNKVNLQRHVRIVHIGYKPYVCTFCNQSFAKRDTLTHHTMRHTGEKPQACELCDFRCIQLVSLQKHMKRHNKQEVAVGKKEAATRKPTVAVARLRTPINCPVEQCDAVFNSKSALQRHTRIVHRGYKPYECTICNVSFSKRETLKHHTMRHTGEKPHVCGVCGRTFIQLVTLRVHMKTHAAKPDTPKVATSYPCDQCLSVFEKSTALRRHIRVVHEGYKPYPCTVCEVSFSKSESLKHHMMRHTGERPHACQLCDRRFIQVVALKAHMNTHAKKGQHTRELSLFPCDKCDLVFKSKATLQRHVRVDHLGNKPFACTHCDLSFAKAETRNDHVMRHTGERPYACQLCDRRFIKVVALKSHMRTHAKLGDTNAAASGITAHE